MSEGGDRGAKKRSGTPVMSGETKYYRPAVAGLVFLNGVALSLMGFLTLAVEYADRQYVTLDAEYYRDQGAVSTALAGLALVFILGVVGGVVWLQGRDWASYLIIVDLVLQTAGFAILLKMFWLDRFCTSVLLAPTVLDLAILLEVLRSIFGWEKKIVARVH